MGTWTHQTWLAASPDEVLGLLTEPDAIARWAPIPFELLELGDERLRSGTRARVGGALLGRQLEFDVEIREADDERLALTADGPVSIDAQYDVRSADGGSDVRASVSVRGRGLKGGLLAGAVDSLLAAGALRACVTRIGRELEPAYSI